MPRCPARICRLLVLAVVLAAAAPPTGAGKAPYVEGGRLGFRLPDLDGNVVASSDERFIGKVLLVDLWGTWCPPCLSEIPTLVELQRRNRDRGFVIVAIAFEDMEAAEERRAHLRSFSRQHGINYLVLDGGSPADFERALPDVRNVKGFPVEIIVDRSGDVVDARNSYGYKKKWARKLEAQLSEILASRY